MPATASRANAVTTVGKRPRRPRARAAVITPAPSAGARRRRATRPAVKARADEAAGAEGGVEVAGAGLTHVEHGHRQHDVQDVESADEDVLRAEQQDEEAHRGLGADRADPGGDLGGERGAPRFSAALHRAFVARRRSFCRDRRRPGDRHNECRRHERQAREEEHRQLRATDPEEDAGDGRRDQDAAVLGPARDHVRRGQLDRSAHDARQQRRLRRPRRRDAEVDDRCHHEHEPGRRVERDRRSHGSPWRSPARGSRRAARAPGVAGRRGRRCTAPGRCTGSAGPA